MKKTGFVVVLFFSLISYVNSQIPETVGRGLEINGGSDREIYLADKAFSHAVSMYESFGFKFDDLSLPVVYIQSPYTIDDQLLPNTIAVYNNVKKEVYMTPFNEESFQNRNILGTFGVEEVFYSILFHEFCHHLNNYLNPAIAPHHDEFIACSLQLRVLSEEVVNSAIEKFNSLVFNSRNDITLIAYIKTPKDFQVASFLFGKRNPLQIKQIIANSHNMVRDPFLVDRL